MSDLFERKKEGYEKRKKRERKKEKKKEKEKERKLVSFFRIYTIC